MYGTIKGICDHLLKNEEGEYFFITERNDKTGWNLVRASPPKIRPYFFIMPKDLDKSIKLLSEDKPYVPEEDFVEIDLEGTTGKVIKIYSHSPHHLIEIRTKLMINDIQCYELTMQHTKFIACADRNGRTFN